MAQKKIAIYITSDVIRICEVEKSGSNLVVSRAFETRTPGNSVEDGLIIDVGRVAEAISSALSQNQIKKPKLIFTIYSRKIAPKEIELPYVSNVNRIGDMITSNLEDYFPMSNMQDYMIRWNILDTVMSEGRKLYRISVVAVQKELVESYYELGRELKMPVITVDYQINSLANLMKKQLKSGISLVLQIDNDVTHVTIADGQTQLFRRSIPHGSDTLIQSFAADNRLDEEEAEIILKDPRMMAENLTPEEYTELARDYSAAITRVVEFYTSKNPELLIEHAKMYGMGAQLPGLSEALERVLSIEIETMHQLNGIQLKKKNVQGLTLDDLAAYLPNIGAMISSLDFRIDEEKMRKTGIGYGLLFALMGITVLAMGGFCVYVYYEGWQLQQTVAVYEKQIDSLKQAEEIFLSYEEAQKYTEIIRDFSADTLNDNEFLYLLITNLEEVMPESVGITNLDSANGEIEISGKSGGKEPLALFILELKKLPYVSEIRLSTMSDTYDDAGRITTDFRMEFRIDVDVEYAQEMVGGDKEYWAGYLAEQSAEEGGEQ